MTEKTHPGPVGTQNGYRKGCRCEECVSASTAASRLAYLRKKNPGYRQEHCGTRYGYVQGCRCCKCRAANATYTKEKYGESNFRYLKTVRAKYGLEPEAYLALAEAQGYACAICSRHESEFVRRLHVDHNHITGEVRGLLCSDCNTSLGKLKADEGPQLLLKALEYLAM